MSTLENTAVHHRHRSVIGAAWFAVGILVAFLVAFAILASAHVTNTALTHRFQPVAVHAHPTARQP